MSKTLIIAEKPSVAKEIATVLDVPPHQSYYENDEIIISHCRGHLLEYTLPEKNLPLPIFPATFSLIPIANTKPLYDLLVHLMNRTDVSTIVNACDAEREGELIFYRVYESAGCIKPVKRMWILSTTKDGYLNAWRQLKDGSEMQNLYQAAKSRAESDWLFGINGSRAIHNAMGRVVTPTLAMIVDAYLTHKNFKPTDYWEIHSTFTITNGEFTAKLLDENKKVAKFNQLNSAQAALTDIQAANHFKVSDEFTIAKKSAPYLFSATSLQKQANKQYKFSAEKTLSIMQSLYQDFKCLTYPRSDYDALPEDFLPTMQQVFHGLGGLEEFQSNISLMYQQNLIVQNPRVFDNSRVDSHYAIVPTGFIKKDGKEYKLSELTANELQQILPPDEYAIFLLVAQRTIAAFFPEAEYAVTTRSVVSGSHVFQTIGKVLKQSGWLAVYGNQDDEEKIIRLPEIQPNEITQHHEISLKKLQTSTPQLLNDATLLTAMETAGRKLDDDELSDIMREVGGLGTAATRPNIIAKLKETPKNKPPYVIEEKNQLIPTERALSVIEQLRTHYPNAVNPILTAQWEQKLAQIAKGTYSREVFMTEIQTAVGQLVAVMQQNVHSGSLKCPCCHQETLANRPKTYTCTECQFTLWKTQYGKTLTEQQIKLLIENGETDFIQGLVGKSGKPFAAKFMLDSENKRVNLEFQNKYQKGKKDE